ncbi:MAG: class I SAM-dependent methyltransferase [Oligoflexales bacterium]
MFFQDQNLLPASLAYQNIPTNLQKSSSLALSFLPLPPNWEMKLYGSSLIERHHHARVQLIRHHLPPAKSVLDLGGAAAEQKCGALLAMGYPHHLDRIHIVDLPMTERIYEPSQIPEAKDHIHGNCKVSYSYHPMHKLEKLVGKLRFDMIWMGQTVEHISPRQLENILEFSRDLLNENGVFCLDTPNRLITKLLDPNRYIHPDHKLEYTPDQLSKIFDKHGYRCIQSKAVTPLPLSLRTGLIHRIETFKGALISDKPSEGFSFYMKFVRK